MLTIDLDLFMQQLADFMCVSTNNSRLQGLENFLSELQFELTRSGNCYIKTTVNDTVKTWPTIPNKGENKGDEK